MKKIIEQIKKVGLTGEQSTKLYVKLEKDYKELQSGMSYSAPEVIKQQMGEFLWNVYIGGRIDEKEDIIKAIDNYEKH